MARLLSLAAVAALLGLASGSRHARLHENVHTNNITSADAAELSRTQDLLSRATQEEESADAVVKAVKDAGIYKAAENLRKAKLEAVAKQQQKLLNTMDLMLRAPAPAEEKAEKDGKQLQPVSTQVSQKDMETFLATLSPDCSKQFSAIMGGNAPAIHTFGEAGVNSTSGGCDKLDGSVCATEAQIESVKTGPAERQIRSLQQVSGDGCLPRHCTQKKDLTALAGFMQSKAKESVPGTGVFVKLQVDCTGSGGDSAKVGFDSDPEPQSSMPTVPSVMKSSAMRAGSVGALALGVVAAL
jgi:hypothetical protein